MYVFYDSSQRMPTSLSRIYKYRQQSAMFRGRVLKSDPLKTLKMLVPMPIEQWSVPYENYYIMTIDLAGDVIAGKTAHTKKVTNEVRLFQKESLQEFKVSDYAKMGVVPSKMNKTNAGIRQTLGRAIHRFESCWYEVEDDAIYVDFHVTPTSYEKPVKGKLQIVDPDNPEDKDIWADHYVTQFKLENVQNDLTPEEFIEILNMKDKSDKAIRSRKTILKKLIKNNDNVKVHSNDMSFYWQGAWEMADEYDFAIYDFSGTPGKDIWAKRHKRGRAPYVTKHIVEIAQKFDSYIDNIARTLRIPDNLDSIVDKAIQYEEPTIIPSQYADAKKGEGGFMFGGDHAEEVSAPVVQTSAKPVVKKAAAKNKDKPRPIPTQSQFAMARKGEDEFEYGGDIAEPSGKPSIEADTPFGKKILASKPVQSVVAAFNKVTNNPAVKTIMNRWKKKESFEGIMGKTLYEQIEEELVALSNEIKRMDELAFQGGAMAGTGLNVLLGFIDQGKKGLWQRLKSLGKKLIPKNIGKVWAARMAQVFKRSLENLSEKQILALAQYWGVSSQAVRPILQGYKSGVFNVAVQTAAGLYEPNGMMLPKGRKVLGLGTTYPLIVENFAQQQEVFQTEVLTPSLEYYFSDKITPDKIDALLKSDKFPVSDVQSRLKAVLGKFNKPEIAEIVKQLGERLQADMPTFLKDLAANNLVPVANPEEQKPEEQKPEEQKPEEQKPEEQQPEEQKPEEQKPEEQRPVIPSQFAQARKGEGEFEFGGESKRKTSSSLHEAPQTTNGGETSDNSEVPSDEIESQENAEVPPVENAEIEPTTPQDKVDVDKQQKMLQELLAAIRTELYAAIQSDPEFNATVYEGALSKEEERGDFVQYVAKLLEGNAKLKNLNARVEKLAEGYYKLRLNFDFHFIKYLMTKHGMNALKMDTETGAPIFGVEKFTKVLMAVKNPDIVLQTIRGDVKKYGFATQGAPVSTSSHTTNESVLKEDFVFSGIKIDSVYQKALYKQAIFILENWKYNTKIGSWKEDFVNNALIDWKKLMLQVSIGVINKDLPQEGLLSNQNGLSELHIDEVMKAIASNKNTDSKKVPDKVKEFLKKYFEMVWPVEKRLLILLQQKKLLDKDGHLVRGKKILEFLTTNDTRDVNPPQDEEFDLTL